MKEANANMSGRPEEFLQRVLQNNQTSELVIEESNCEVISTQPGV